jgi:hypothetical protein
MASLLSYGDQAFWVNNGAKDLLYQAAIAVARRAHPAAYQRLSEDGRLLGAYLVSGLGFPLEAFAEAFGGARAWEEATAMNFGAVEALCANPECVALMTKVLAWVWFLLDGGHCNDAAGRYPGLRELPDTPGEGAAPVAVERRGLGPAAHGQGLTPSTKFKFAFGIGVGALFGTVVGVANMLLGLAQNWLTIPAWVFIGALLGFAHPTVDAIWSAINRPPEQWPKPDDPSGPAS